MQNELKEAKRSSDLDFDYITTMITEHTGVRIEADKKVNLLIKFGYFFDGMSSPSSEN